MAAAGEALVAGFGIAMEAAGAHAGAADPGVEGVGGPFDVGIFQVVSEEFSKKTDHGRWLGA
jgi:hypothetical protein